jgi:predicted nucleic acid-binding protein
MNSTVVLDASFVLKWVLNEPDSSKALALLTEWVGEEVVMLAPALLAYEAANALYQHVRSGKFSADAAKQSLTDVILKGLTFDFSSDLALSMRAIELAGQYNLSATYDPHYLALAEREGCEFWTADLKMWNVIRGKIDWVHWIGDEEL